MNVLIISEDHLSDQLILVPIMTALIKSVGKPANVEINTFPRLRGVAEALDWNLLSAIVQKNKYKADLFILCVDRDGETTRKEKLRYIEEQAKQELAKSPGKKLFLTVEAEQELEVWLLAGQNLPREWVWRNIRSERDPKEKYFEPYLQQRGYKNKARARAELGKEAAGHYDRIKQLCPEVAELEERIRDWIDSL